MFSCSYAIVSEKEGAYSSIERPSIEQRKTTRNIAFTAHQVAISLHSLLSISENILFGVYKKILVRVYP